MIYIFSQDRNTHKCYDEKTITKKMKEEQAKSNHGCQIMDIRVEFEIRRCARK